MSSSPHSEKERVMVQREEREGGRAERKRQGRVGGKKEGSMRNENGKRKGNGALATIWHALACL